ncbi:MAG TPA: sodium:proton antiporter [Ruminococcaceae bacterium]|nr:sodium:proton antiporter [Oscillospiraceae bacterium]
MDAIQVGFLSVLPPVIAIVLALISKEVISSLLIGILSGAFIYSVNTGGGIIKTVEVAFSLMTTKVGDNAFIIIFLALLGALVVVITKAGGSQAYGAWAASKIKSRAWAQLATSILGVVIFIDDYFNCLTVGTVMRPVTDKHNVSRAKLAYIIDATAAPVCIIAPVSSWAASVISYMDGTGLNGMTAFVQTIPYNLYAVLTIVMIIVLAVTGLDFGPMARFENNAVKNGDLFTTKSDAAGDELQNVKVSSKGRVMDLIVPILALIIFAILGMLYVGGYFSGEGMSLAEAFGNTDASVGITYGAFAALIVAFLMFVPRGLLSFKEFFEGITQGVKSMVPAFIILTLAWSISGICRDLLSTGQYVGDLVAASNMPVVLIPAIVFAVAAFLSFSMGTSWGTFGILIPIIAAVCQAVAPHLTIVALSATLAGSVFGDHCSPISDTTILSSTGAGCNHIDHVSTQIPYALFVAIVCFIGYIVAGITNNVYITLIVSLALLIGSMIFLHKYFGGETKAKA